ncbi:winged helix-turn-helix domain-containing protein [Pseudoalteromonas sp. Of7M-16]|uniref:ArsR/SmtB family transcription factor n=1 Tax=Pseudoalteromonas sp. Of7M-16 TaxID=2917756 RepID=UPI001EF4C4EE|nr:winged helix-turn-helix domain-containing protein [Pseudoalteromonas sp. Of7M-16]MCG7547872.1 winged helix-turn-helix domain-containing protein [Pseudoalteromonas sp. Of7M-16]
MEMMEPDISMIAGLIADPARSKILTALMGGKALTATELSLEADVTPQTTSSHLAKLLDGELLQVRKQGRHKYFQLKGPHVAIVLEQLLVLTALSTPKTTTGPKDPRLKHARVCYDHLAGELGVRLYDALVSADMLEDFGELTRLTEKGKTYFVSLGVDFKQFKKNSRPVCKSCLDWSERRNHMAGHLGNWVLNYIFEKNWAKQDLDARSITFTNKGLTAFKRAFLIED